jgi:pyruvate dehydrogenase E2 component (dihydrolipoamide acetyltransferase)
MPITVAMPALSPTMTEGTLARWLVNEGDTVSSGDVLAEIETDKATMEVESIEDGTVGRILVDAGTENVAVNTPILLILEEGEDASALDEAAAKAPEPAPAPKPESSTPEPAPQPAPEAPRKAARQPAAPAPQAGSDRIFASPLAKRLAANNNLDLKRIEGSGPRGRIVKRDIERALSQPEAARAEPAAAAPAMVGDRPYTEVPHSSMRKTIARRLTEAKRDIPHIYLTVDCRIDELLDMRKRLNAKADNYKISVNDFVIRACALALRKVPDVNVSWSDAALLKHEVVDVSVAVALEGGLITPIVRDADKKGLAVISNEVKELADRARQGKLMPEEYQGGTFSVSNLGMYGIREFSAVINPPQSAILAVGAGEQRPVVKDGALSVATVMTCTLSSDHRTVDGALGAQFLQVFKDYIEDPLTMLL